MRLKQLTIGQIAVSFGKKTVKVEAITGTIGTKSFLDRFKTVKGKSWVDYLMDRLENHAKETGFKAVMIRRPETLPDYYNPSGAGNIQEAERIRKNMKTMYYRITENRGYLVESDFFVKEL